jgi:hypothetical protein
MVGMPAALVIASALPLVAQSALVDGFKDPPNIARPRVYWYWQNGNITRDGLSKDLEWMHRAGIGGVETFDVAVATPTVVKNRLIYMQPEWKDAFLHSLEVTDRLGMTVTIGAAPGWSQTGGPWVKPIDAMKKLVWTETRVEGGKPFSGILAKPPQINGPFQDQPHDVRLDRPIPNLPTLYKDQLVIAFRAPAGESTLEEAHPIVTASGGSMTYSDLINGSYDRTRDLPATAGSVSWVQIAFDSPQTIRGVTVATHGVLRAFTDDAVSPQTLEVSDDGVHFRRVIDMPRGNLYQRTYAFAPVKGRYFRYRLPMATADTIKLARFQLHTTTPVNRAEEQAAFAAVPDYYAVATPHADVASVIGKSDVINLTGKMREDGTLDWAPPAGKWIVARMGYSLTGQTNSPAPLEATGYEVDKLKKGATKTFMDEYLKLYEDASKGRLGQHGVNNVATDSWEAGFQNWTDGILEDFRRLRGYDPTPWLPALTGRVVQSNEETDRFLWDFRRTIANLVITSNFDQVRDSLHARGLGYVTEAMAGRRATIGDAMEMKTRADYPMGEFWLPTLDRQQQGYFADLRDTASVANIYGKKLATAESITSTGIPYAYAPWDIKSVADEEFLGGINQFTLHVSVHQPNDNAPGLALGQYGMWFNRLETWAEQARAWTDYIARSCFLLQQGKAVIDVAYFYGEESSATGINHARAPQIAEGYNYDFVNSESLLNEFSVQDGRLVTKSGMQYRVLYLGGTSNRMTLRVLNKIRSLVKAGAIVVGLPPTDSPSMSDDVVAWKAEQREVWGTSAVRHQVGLGKVYRTLNLDEVLGAENIQPDFKYIKPDQDAVVQFTHRRDGDTDIYFVNNRVDHVAYTTADFRVTGKAPEFWTADTGKIQPASYNIHDGVTTVPLRMEPRDAFFVVFRQHTASVSREVAAPIRTTLANVSGPWQVEFQAGRGAPKSAEFSELSDWSNNSNPGIKYFSGVATYTKKIDVPASALTSGARIELDLGKVHELAEVAVNGKTEGIAWKPPYRVDITEAVKIGENTLSIKVVNLWPNRLIGDQQPGMKKVAFAPNSTYKANDSLLPSGLVGPVEVDRLSPAE